MTIPQSFVSKINPGERVLIKLDAYPYEHYGVVKGTVKRLLTIIKYKGEFSIEVQINTSSVSKNPSIVLRSGMLANAEVITQNISIFQRITSTFFERQKE